MDLKELFVREKLSTGDPYRLWAQDQYLTTLKIVTGLIVLVHPSFHFILNAFNLNVPDSLLNRLVTALCSVILLAIADGTSWGRRNTAFIFGTSMLILNASTFLLVLFSGNHPIYISASLIVVMAGSLAFLTVRDHLIVIGLSFLFFVAVNVSLEPLSINWLPIAVIAPPCLIAIAGNVLKVILHRRQFETGKALEYQKQTLQETLESVRSIKEQMVQQSQVALMGKMTSGLAHEINNPLAIAMGVVDSLRTGKVPTENADPYLRKVETALGRIRSIVSEMRLVSSSYDNETLQRVPLGEIVNTLRLIVNPIAIKNKVLLTIIEPPDVFLMCYKSKLTMALVNVLVNGVDFTPKAVEESWVLMTFEISGEKLFIDVTDSGQIDPTKAMMIFLPFYTTKEVSQGIGLGLSTARGVFETHRGSIELVPDRPNTTFRITLNIAA